MSTYGSAIYVLLCDRTGKYLSFLIDTGAAISVLKEEVIGQRYVDKAKRIKVQGISGSAFETLGSTKVSLKHLRKLRFTFDFHVLPTGATKLNVDGILGSDFFTHFNADIRYSQLCLQVANQLIPLHRYDEILSLTVPSSSRSYVHMLTHQQGEVIIEDCKISDNVFLLGSVQTVNAGRVTLVIENHSHQDFPLRRFKPTVTSASETQLFSVEQFSAMKKDEADEINVELNVNGLSPETAQRVNKLYNEFRDVFHVPVDPVNTAKGFEHDIHLKPETAPRYVKQYRLPPVQQRLIADSVRKMVSDGIAEPSTSAWNAPVLVVPKKGENGKITHRVVIDFRRLNDVIDDDKYPIPDINTILDGLGQAKYFTTLDLNQGYYQIKLGKRSRPYTAFTTSDGHFQLTRMPMGLKTSPPAFSRIMAMALGEYVGKICYIYIDDIIVYGATEEEHEENLRKVLQRLREVGLKLKPQKCKFFQKEVTYLGHVISAEGLKPDPEKYDPIRNWPLPKKVVELQSFLGLVNYYRRFVKDFSKTARPLYKLTESNTPFVWTVECQLAFDELKLKVTTPPVLAYPDFDHPFIVQTDASEIAIGAVIMNHDRRPIAFISRTLKAAERFYHITDLELLAMVWSAKKFNHYLYGQKFTFETDHKALEWLYKQTDPSNRLTRFRLKLEQYDFTVKHIKGQKNAVADALSRVQLESQQLRKMECNVVTRMQKKRLEQSQENKERSRKDAISTPKSDADVVTELLRIQNDMPLIKICKDAVIDTSQHVLTNNDKTVGYCPEEGLIYIYLSEAIVEATLENDLEYVRVGLKLICQKANLTKVAICKSEIAKIGTDTKRILRILAKTKKNEFKMNLFVIPEAKHVTNEEERRAILEKAHNLPTGGHPGRQKMWVTLKLRYYWPNMRRDVENFVKDCKICQTFKHSTQRRIPMQLTDTATRRFERVFMDIMGPFPKTDSGNAYILTVQDDLTKFIEACVLPDKSANTVARALVENFFLKYHFPEYLVSDCGTEFANRVMESVCQLLKMKQVTSAPYHHQTIGALENSHKSIGNYLRCIAQDDSRNWDLWMPYSTYVYNSQVHFATGYAPFELVFGENNPLPDGTIERSRPLYYDLDEYDQELKTRLRIAIEDARKHQINQKERRKITYDAKFSTAPKRIEVGDYILIKNETGTKLDAIWTGPYEVIKTSASNVFIKARGKERKIHLDNVKIFHDICTMWIMNH